MKISTDRILTTHVGSLPRPASLEAKLLARERGAGSVAKIVKLEHAWRRLDGRNDDGFQVAPFPG